MGKGGKPLPEKGKRTQLFWEADAVFDGMNVSVRAMDRGLGIFFLDLKSGEKFEPSQARRRLSRCGFASTTKLARAAGVRQQEIECRHMNSIC